MIKHTVDEAGLCIKMRWVDFRKKHNINWVEKINRAGKICYVPTWPEDCKEFIRTHNIEYSLKGSGKYVVTPDDRTVEMKNIEFLFPSKDIMALFKISYL